MQDLFERSQPEGYVYLLQYAKEPIYKIGRTNTPARRFRELKVAVPYPVDLVCAIPTDSPEWLERYWHRRFRLKRRGGSARVRHSEWFDLNADDVNEFMREPHPNKHDEDKLQPALPFPNNSVRDAAIDRVEKFYDDLIAQHPYQAVKLAKSCEWQVRRLDNVDLASMDKGAQAKHLAKWEDAACRAAEAKIKR